MFVTAEANACVRFRRAISCGHCGWPRTPHGSSRTSPAPRTRTPARPSLRRARVAEVRAGREALARALPHRRHAGSERRRQGHPRSLAERESSVLASSKMPLFEIDTAGELVPFRAASRRRGALRARDRGPRVGEPGGDHRRDPLPRAATAADSRRRETRTSSPSTGAARVVVIEVKREFDRSQLAQCLEYAGWARRTNLDELAQMYRNGPSGSSATGRSSPSPRARSIVNPSPDSSCSPVPSTAEPSRPSSS